MTNVVGAIEADLVHGTTVAIGDAGLLILGPAGSGKSALALQLMAMGASLVADDRTHIGLVGTDIVAFAPDSTKGLIEARFVGILNAPVRDSVMLHLVVDLGQTETMRLPPRRAIRINGRVIDLVFGVPSAHFPASLMAYVAGGRQQ